MRFKLKLRSTVDEAAKWRGTSYEKELTQPEIDRLISAHGASVLGVHYDNGVPTGKDTSMIDGDVAVSGQEIRPRGRELTEPQQSFNPRAGWNTPVGIYYYPMSWAGDRIMQNAIPFAGSSKYVYIYKIKDPSKRLDVSDIPRNGMIERILFELVKKGDALRRILVQSDFSDEAIQELSKLYFSGSTADLVLQAFLEYADTRYKDLFKDIFDRIIRGDSTEEAKYSYEDVISVIAYNIAESMPESGLPEYYNETVHQWHPPIEKALEEMGVKKLFYETHEVFRKGLNKSDPNFVIKLTAKFQELNSAYLSKKQSSSASTDSKKTPITKPPPNGSVASILADDGYDDKRITRSCYYVLNNFLERKPARLTKYLLDKGYDVLEDLQGTGSIHDSEPVQGIILRVGAAQVVGVYLNRYRTGRNKPAEVDPKQMESKKLIDLLGGSNGSKFVKPAIEFIKKNPALTNSMTKRILDNENIKRTPELAEQLADLFVDEVLNIVTLNTFIGEFAPVISVQQMENLVSKMLSGTNEDLINREAVSGDYYLSQFLQNAFRHYENNDKKKIDSSTPTLKSIVDAIAHDSDQRAGDALINNLKYYEIKDIKQGFPTLLKLKTLQGTIAFDVAVSNVVEHIDFKKRPVEDRMEFNEWLFANYPQAWKDDRVIRSALSSMRWTRQEDDATVEAEEAFNKKLKEGFYGKLLSHWEKMKENPELLDKLAKEREAINKMYSKPQVAIQERRFKKLNRIGRYSRFN